MIDANIECKHKFSAPHKFAMTVTVDGLQENDYRGLAEDVCKNLFDSKDKGFVVQVMRMTNEIRTKLEPMIDNHFAKSSAPLQAHFAFCEKGRVVDAA